MTTISGILDPSCKPIQPSPLQRFGLCTLVGAMMAACVCLPACAGEATITIENAYARSGPQSGAAFFTIRNEGDADDRLVAAQSDAAGRTELHTHMEDENGVVRMRPVEDGFLVPAGGEHALERGGDHIMFMGLDAPFADGSSIPVTLSFERAGNIDVEIPVDNGR
jgi:copper(I)-binding protein